VMISASACVDIQQGVVCWVSEETSLVARPGVPMDVIQKRMELRLEHLGIHVRSIEEDE
jgi:hypothetical protein